MLQHLQVTGNTKQTDLVIVNIRVSTSLETTNNGIENEALETKRKQASNM